MTRPKAEKQSGGVSFGTRTLTPSFGLVYPDADTAARRFPCILGAGSLLAPRASLLPLGEAYRSGPEASVQWVSPSLTA